MSSEPARGSRFGATLRQTDRVTPLELFFDLVFVLAITQCTVLMAADPTWRGLAKGLAVLSLLFGWTKKRSGSLYGAIVLHAINNLYSAMFP